MKVPTIASAYVAEETEDEQIELLLGALDELGYPDEYLLLSSVYVNRLVSKGWFLKGFNWLFGDK